MRPFDSIILNEDLPEYGIRAGTEGAIVEQYRQTDDVYMVEFFDNTGKTLNVIDVRADQMTVTLADFYEGERIALLADFPKYKVLRGQVGVIQKRVGVGFYEVEFADQDGRPYAHLKLHAQQMLLLHWEPAQSQQSA